MKLSARSNTFVYYTFSSHTKIIEKSRSEVMQWIIANFLPIPRVKWNTQKLNHHTRNFRHDESLWNVLFKYSIWNVGVSFKVKKDFKKIFVLLFVA